MYVHYENVKIIRILQESGDLENLLSINSGRLNWPRFVANVFHA